MLNIPGSSRIFLYTGPTNMRKSFRGLTALVYEHHGRPEDGSYYVFINRRQTHVKILYWDGDGLAVWYKRLEKGQFALPEAEGSKIQLSRRQLSLLLDGVIPMRLNPRFYLKKSQEGM